MLRSCFAAAASIVVIALTGFSGAHVCPAQVLPSDPAIIAGTLENGLKYQVRRHANPPGRVLMWLHIHSGSLNETDAQRGIAHYLEHMAFNGSENFPPGAVVPFFQSLGMTFGRDQNAFTSYDQTTYQLTLPDTDAETLDKGMTFFADVLFRLTLNPTEIDAERQIIQEERRRGLSARQRTNDYVMARLTPGSRFGHRSPIGTEETIDSVKQSDFRDYYDRWYTASNATLMVVADADPAVVIGRIRTHFGPAPTRPRPSPEPLNVRAYPDSFAIVVADDELRTESVRIVRIEPARPPVTTVPQMREELLTQIGRSAFNRRIEEKVAAGGTSYLNARASAGTQAGAIFTAELSARPNPGQWQTALEAVVTELQRARAFGFGSDEIELVKRQMLSGAERAVETEATVQAQSLISRMNGAVASGEPVLAPAQRLKLLQDLLPGILAEEISAAFQAEFDMQRAAFVAVLPSSTKAPTEAELLAIGRRAFEAKPEREAHRAVAAKLMESPPPPGRIESGEEHSPSQVWSGWLSNNVRVHHRFMDEQKNDVSISITLVGGELLEDASTRGLTQAAQLAWSRPATAGLTSTQIRELMTGRKVSVRGGGGMGGRRGGRGGGGGGAGGAGVSINISGSPDELETGLQLAYLLLTEPRIEPAVFEQFRVTTREGLLEALKSPTAMGARLAAAAPYPDDEPRMKPLTIEQLDRITLEDAQRWLDKLIRTSPIEITVVGDMPRERVLEQVAAYVGALPSRERISPKSFAELRRIARPAGPRTFEQTIDSATPTAFVFAGFYGANDNDLTDARALSMAARILSTRMVREVREEAQLVYSIGASSRTASTFPGFGVFSAAAPTEPAKCDALVSKLNEMYAAFAADGPSADELDVARRQMANTFADQVRQPSYWSSRLNLMTFRNTRLDDVLAEPTAYQELTAEQIRAAFAKYYRPDSRITVVVRPSQTGSAAPAEPIEPDSD